eukprot:30919-Pelagococcus_subviridis.AAC.4
MRGVPPVPRPPRLPREALFVELAREDVVHRLVPLRPHPDELILPQDGLLRRPPALGRGERVPRALQDVLASDAKLFDAVGGHGVFDFLKARVAALGAKHARRLTRHLPARVAPKHPPPERRDAHPVRGEELEVHLEDDVLHRVVRGDARDGGLDRRRRAVGVLFVLFFVLVVLVLRALGDRLRVRREERRGLVRARVRGFAVVAVVRRFAVVAVVRRFAVAAVAAVAAVDRRHPRGGVQRRLPRRLLLRLSPPRLALHPPNARRPAHVLLPPVAVVAVVAFLAFLAAAAAVRRRRRLLRGFGRRRDGGSLVRPPALRGAHRHVPRRLRALQRVVVHRRGRHPPGDLVRGALRLRVQRVELRPFVLVGHEVPARLLRARVVRPLRERHRRRLRAQVRDAVRFALERVRERDDLHVRLGQRAEIARHARESANHLDRFLVRVADDEVERQRRERAPRLRVLDLAQHLRDRDRLLGEALQLEALDERVRVDDRLGRARSGRRRGRVRRVAVVVGRGHLERGEEAHPSRGGGLRDDDDDDDDDARVGRRSTRGRLRSRSGESAAASGASRRNVGALSEMRRRRAARSGTSLCTSLASLSIDVRGSGDDE